MSKGKMKMFTCPCGWIITTPMGDDDIVKHVIMHGKDAHPEMKLAREEILKRTKKRLGENPVFTFFKAAVLKELRRI